MSSGREQWRKSTPVRQLHNVWAEPSQTRDRCFIVITDQRLTCRPQGLGDSAFGALHGSRLALLTSDHAASCFAMCAMDGFNDHSVTTIGRSNTSGCTRDLAIDGDLCSFCIRISFAKPRRPAARWRARMPDGRSGGRCTDGAARLVSARGNAKNELFEANYAAFLVTTTLT